MPVEIRELIITANVVGAPSENSVENVKRSQTSDEQENKGLSASTQHFLIQECVDQVLDILKRSKEY